MAKEKSDSQLIKEFRAGKQASFEELIGRYADKAFSLATRLTGSQQDAEEVLQDVFVTVYRKIAGFEGKSSFSSWLYRITVNACLMKLRKKNQERCTLIDDLALFAQTQLSLRSDETAGGDHYTLRCELASALEQAIRRLPDDYRPVFVLRDVDGLTSNEVSQLLDLSIPAVKSRLHRSRLLLRDRLDKVYGEYRPFSRRSDRKVGNF